MHYREDAKRAERYLPGITKLFDRYAGRCIAMCRGRNRFVFVMDKYVVKLPLNNCGVSDNDWEGSVCGSVEGGIQFARTRLHWYKGEIAVCFMERISDLSWDDLRAIYGGNEGIPKWVDYVDCGQVGYNRNGRLVAYDFGRT